jgi:hypothetical protein
MSVSFLSAFVLSCVGSGLTTGWSPVKEVLPSVYRISSFTLILNGRRPESLIRQIGRIKKLLHELTAVNWKKRIQQ